MTAAVLAPEPPATLAALLERQEQGDIVTGAEIAGALKHNLQSGLFGAEDGLPDLHQVRLNSEECTGAEDIQAMVHAGLDFTLANIGKTEGPGLQVARVLDATAPSMRVLDYTPAVRSEILRKLADARAIFEAAGKAVAQAIGEGAGKGADVEELKRQQRVLGAQGEALDRAEVMSCPAAPRFPQSAGRPDDGNTGLG